MYKGRFILRAQKDGAAHDLIGHADTNQLTWVGKNIVRSVNNVAADADGNVNVDVNTGPYITYSSFNPAGQRSWLREWSNNVLELGGYAAGQNQTITLPRAFADANYYVSICPTGGASEVGVTNITASSFTVVFENISSSGFFWHAIGKYA